MHSISGVVFDVATPRASRGVPKSRLEPVRFRHQDGRGQERETEFPDQPQLDSQSAHGKPGDLYF